ncbi:MAG: hypothetical protein OXC10_01450 [Rhodospirillaceae bacterium]|nr:hypothetical protein [Rhodospirillaceae bacterium]
MTEGPQILGVWLLRDEENFAAWSLLNAVEFCDRVLVMDNRSRDRTRQIVEAVAARYRHVEILDVDDARDTHKYLEDYAGTRTWVFGVDGDEIYDPAGLARMRPRLLAGEFDGYWRIAGHMRHVLGIRFDRAEAFGYTQPDAPEGTKLFNFSVIDDWRPGPHERLHGRKSIVFRPGYARDSVLRVWKSEGWDQTDFRCLHLCFVTRSRFEASSPEKEAETTGRANPRERWGERSLLRRVRRAVMRRLDPHYDLKRNYKRRNYARGPVASFEITGFGAPNDFRTVDPGCAAAHEAVRTATERWSRMQPRLAP